MKLLRASFIVTLILSQPSATFCSSHNPHDPVAVNPRRTSHYENAVWTDEARWLRPGATDDSFWLFFGIALVIVLGELLRMK